MHDRIFGEKSLGGEAVAINFDTVEGIAIDGMPKLTVDTIMAVEKGVGESWDSAQMV